MLHGEPKHHAGIFVLQKMTVRHVGMFFGRIVAEFHQDFTLSATTA